MSSSMRILNTNNAHQYLNDLLSRQQHDHGYDSMPCSCKGKVDDRSRLSLYLTPATWFHKYSEANPHANPYHDISLFYLHQDGVISSDDTNEEENTTFSPNWLKRGSNQAVMNSHDIQVLMLSENKEEALIILNDIARTIIQHWESNTLFDNPLCNQVLKQNYDLGVQYIQSNHHYGRLAIVVGFIPKPVDCQQSNGKPCAMHDLLTIYLVNPDGRLHIVPNTNTIDKPKSKENKCTMRSTMFSSVLHKQYWQKVDAPNKWGVNIDIDDTDGRGSQFTDVVEVVEKQHRHQQDLICNKASMAEKQHRHQQDLICNKASMAIVSHIKHLIQTGKNVEDQLQHSYAVLDFLFKLSSHYDGSARDNPMQLKPNMVMPTMFVKEQGKGVSFHNDGQQYLLKYNKECDYDNRVRFSFVEHFKQHGCLFDVKCAEEHITQEIVDENKQIISVKLELVPNNTTEMRLPEMLLSMSIGNEINKTGIYDRLGTKKLAEQYRHLFYAQTVEIDVKIEIFKHKQGDVVWVGLSHENSVFNLSNNLAKHLFLTERPRGTPTGQPIGTDINVYLARLFENNVLLKDIIADDTHYLKADLNQFYLQWFKALELIEEQPCSFDKCVDELHYFYNEELHSALKTQNFVIAIPYQDKDTGKTQLVNINNLFPKLLPKYVDDVVFQIQNNTLFACLMVSDDEMNEQLVETICVMNKLNLFNQ